jgi:hypothetical protein
MAYELTTEMVERALWAKLKRHAGHRVVGWQECPERGVINIFCSCRTGIGDGWAAWLRTEDVCGEAVEFPEAWKVVWARSQAQRTEALALMGLHAQSDLVAAVRALVAANARLSEQEANRISSEAEVNRLLEVVHRLEPRARAWDRVYEGCEPTEGAIREVRAALHAFPEERRRWCHESDEKPPTALQAESGPSAVASAKPAPVRRPLVVYSEDD